MIECEECGRDTPQVLFEQPWGMEWRAKCNVCRHITIESNARHQARGSEITAADHFHRVRLVPVPKGMCPAFYEFMGAGGVRSDSGEILMIGDHSDDQKTEGLESL